MRDYFGNLNIVFWVFLALVLAVFLLLLGVIHFSIRKINKKFNKNFVLKKPTFLNFKLAR